MLFLNGVTIKKHKKDDAVSCFICLDTLDDDDDHSMVVSSSCGHTMHYVCSQKKPGTSLSFWLWKDRKVGENFFK